MLSLIKIGNFSKEDVKKLNNLLGRGFPAPEFSIMDQAYSQPFTAGRDIGAFRLMKSHREAKCLVSRTPAPDSS